MDALPADVLDHVLRACVELELELKVVHQPVVAVVGIDVDAARSRTLRELSLLAAGVGAARLSGVCRRWRAAVERLQVWAGLLYDTFGERLNDDHSDGDDREVDVLDSLSRRLFARRFAQVTRRAADGLAMSTASSDDEEEAQLQLQQKQQQSGWNFISRARNTLVDVLPNVLKPEPAHVLGLCIGYEMGREQLFKIKTGSEPGNLVPITIGMPILSCDVRNGRQSWNFLTLGGQDKIRPLWRHYLPNVNVLVACTKLVPGHGCWDGCHEWEELVYEIWRLLYPNCLRDPSTECPALRADVLTGGSDSFRHRFDVEPEDWDELRQDNAERFAPTAGTTWPKPVEGNLAYSELPPNVRLAVVLVHDGGESHTAAQSDNSGPVGEAPHHESGAEAKRPPSSLSVMSQMLLLRLRPWLLPVAQFRLFSVNENLKDPYAEVKDWIDER